jgi:predicted Co/Zn/Cd cation transporter (cation efflux family)
MYLEIPVFFGLFILFFNFFRYPFALSFCIAQMIAGSFALLTQGRLLQAILYFFIWSAALSIYEDGRRLDVRFKFWFALLTLILPIVGIPIYFLLRNKLSRKIGKTIKTNDGKITFYNN